MQLKVSRCHRDREDKFPTSSSKKFVPQKHLISIQVHVLKIHVCTPIRFCTKVVLTEYMVLFACISQISSVFMYVHFCEHMQAHGRNHFVQIVKILVFLLLPFIYPNLSFRVQGTVLLFLMMSHFMHIHYLVDQFCVDSFSFSAFKIILKEHLSSYTL